MDKSTVFVKAEAREPDSIDSSSSDYGDDCDSVQDSASDEDEIRPTTQTLGFSINYVEGWRRIDAFREFYQNWKDAIVEKFDIDPRDPNAFKPRWKETKTQIQITIHRAIPGANGRPCEELLGYIRFNTKQGTLEISNFNARLAMRHLTLGTTTKRGYSQFAGTHGEGFKLAALVMRRAGHAVRIRSSSFSWTFGFRGTNHDKFYCRLSPLMPDKLQKEKKAFAKKIESAPRSALTSYAWQDVTVKISNSKENPGAKITEQEFRSWAAVSLDLSGPPPERIIWTQHGDLILDKEYSGRVYLKGLWVAENFGPDEPKYVFGYNFAQGHINRDRERLTSPMQEAAILAKIWEEPILGGREDVLRHYIDLFHQHEDSPDIAFAQKVVSEAAARAIWDAMRRWSPAAFFHLEEDGADQRIIIVDNLKKQPESVPKGLWKILRKFALVRTPQEERFSRFMSSEPANIVENAFNSNISRIFRAAMQLDERLKAIKIEVVKGGVTGINVVFKEEEHTMLIHERWFDVDKIHEDTGCELFMLAQQTSLSAADFSCDHVVEDLLNLVLDEVHRHIEGEALEVSKIRGTARQLIHQTPRGIRVCQTQKAGELKVTWIGNESESIVRQYSDGIFYNAVLHKVSSCGSQRLELLQFVDDCGAPSITCGCPYQVVSWASCTATFGALDPTEEYFPMVARARHATFFGVPPAPVRARRRDTIQLLKLSPQDHSRQINKPRTPEANELPSYNEDEGPLHDDIGNSRSDYIDNDSSDGTYHHDDAYNSVSGQRNEGNTNSLRGETIAVAPVEDIPGGPAVPPEVRKDSPRPALLEADDPRASQEDESAWNTWHLDELPRIASRVFGFPVKTCLCESNNGFIDSSLICQRLNFTFQTDTYVRIREQSEGHPQYIALIHGVHGGAAGCLKSSHLAATKYSFLQPGGLIPNLLDLTGGREEEISCRELVLNFRSPDDMGGRTDLQAINIEDILEVQALPLDFEVLHCVQPPPDPSGILFCRFARSVSQDGIVVMPLAPHLLDRRNRQKLDGFPETSVLSVVDLSPNILGPLEGFVNTGCTAFAGIGFDEEHDSTWRVRYPNCQVFDGAPQNVFDDLASGKLAPLGIPPSSHPNIALISGGNSNFGLSHGNRDMPPVESFLSPLNILDSVTKSRVHPNFTVLHMPAAVLHASTGNRLAESIFRLLEQRQSVRINLLSLRDHGIPQDRRTLVVVASPFPALAKVTFRKQALTDADGNGDGTAGLISKVKDFIGDLSFENPRTMAGSGPGFVCSSGSSEARFAGLPKNIYNHQTGRLSAVEAVSVVDMESETVSLTKNSQYGHPLIHPDRQDNLTVRELARLQGFGDDFVFYGPIGVQYEQVFAGHSPILAKIVAEAIRSVVSMSRRVQLSDGIQNDRGIKRPRVEGRGS